MRIGETELSGKGQTRKQFALTNAEQKEVRRALDLLLEKYARGSIHPSRRQRIVALRQSFIKAKVENSQ